MGIPDADVFLFLETRHESFRYPLIALKKIAPGADERKEMVLA
jgi:hypothetical protein